MLPGLIPKALRITEGTEVKMAHRLEVGKDPPCPTLDPCPQMVLPGKVGEGSSPPTLF